MKINLLLKKATSICLITDIWTNKQMLDFMGVAAAFINDNCEREILVIGLKLMPGRHNAENVKKAIESIVNEYDFDKSCIHGHSSDEGSAYVRLMKQLFIDDIAQEFHDEYDDDHVFNDLREVENDGYDMSIETPESDEQDAIGYVENFATTHDFNTEYNSHLKPIIQYAENIGFENNIRVRSDINHDSVSDDEDDDNIDDQEAEEYDFSRPIIDNEDQLVTTIGEAVRLQNCGPIKELNIELGDFDFHSKGVKLNILPFSY